MRKPTLGVLLLALLFGPASCLLSLAVVLNPAAHAACLPAGNLVVAQSPRELVAATADGSTIALSSTQLTRAATIISVGGGTNGVGRDGIVIALMAALTESSLRLLANTDAYPESGGDPNDGVGGDHDSLGLFQMRPSTGWGTVEQLMDAEYQARAFYGGPNGPNNGSPRGLLDLPGWQALSKGEAAQGVEVSAFPDRYARFEPVAETILGALASPTASGSCDDSGNALGLLPSDFAGALIDAAQRQLGQPYVWGGGTFTGPSGVGSDGRGPGFDCSGLVLYAAYQASRGALRLPHYSGAQITFGAPVSWGDQRPGDLIFFTQPGSAAPHHVAISLGADRILQAPRTGQNVRFGTVSEFAGEVLTVRRLSL
jgi:cell wall-associated NlpC family hydrolase